MGRFKDSSLLIGGGFGKTQNYFPTTDLDSGETTNEQKQFGSFGVYYQVPIYGQDWFSINAQLGLAINFSGGDSEKLSSEILDTSFTDTRIIRTTRRTVSNLSFLDLPRIGVRLGIERLYAEPLLGFGYGWNDPRIRIEQADVLERRYYDQGIGYYWKEEDSGTKTIAEGAGETDSGAYGVFGIGIGSRLGDIFGLRAELLKRSGFVDALSGQLAAEIYF